MPTENISFAELELKGHAVGFAKEGYVSQTIAVTAAEFKDGKKVLDVAMKQEEILPGLTPADLESLAPIEGKLFEHSASVKTIDSAWNNKTVAQDGAFVDHARATVWRTRAVTPRESFQPIFTAS